MLFPELSLFLASQSPRRKDLLKKAGLSFEVISKNVEEIIPEGIPVLEVPAYLAKLKGDAVKDVLNQANQVIISSDTIVALGNTIYGKPKNAADAKNTLLQLSGKKHQVITGVCLTSLAKQYCFAETADVYFNELSEAEIDYYIETYKPYDKAGAYAIQEWIGLVAIEKIDGCYFNIMGLPVSKLVQELRKFT